MARPRGPHSGLSSGEKANLRAQARGYANAYQERQARARALGFPSEYERRIRRGGGPDAPRPTGEALRRARGHAGYQDLLQRVEGGGLEGAVVIPAGRDDQGQFTHMDVTVFGPWTGDAGVTYTLSGPALSKDAAAALVDALDDAGMDVQGMHYLERMSGETKSATEAA